MTHQEPKPNAFIERVIITLVYLALIWTVHIFQYATGIDWRNWGVIPRTEEGLWGILFMAFLHQDFNHLINNSTPLAVLFLCTIQFYPKACKPTIVGIHIVSAALVWLFARTSIHIGASGVVYGLGTFLFFSGWFRRDVKSMGIACIVAFLYGSMVWGVLPIKQGVSWEGHLFGALTGIFFAYFFRKTDARPPYSWELEEEEFNHEFKYTD